MNIPQFQRFYYAESLAGLPSSIEGKGNEQEIIQLKEQINRLEERVNLLLKYIQVNESSTPTLIISGANLQILNSAQDVESNGLGNLIVGNNKLRNTTSVNDRNGSHNIIVGDYHHYTGCSSIILGRKNTSNSNSSLIGGFKNKISSDYSSILSGCYNRVKEWGSCVLGGRNKDTAFGHHQSKLLK